MELDAVYGVPLGDLDVVEVPPVLAGLFAAAHLRVTGRPAGAHAGGGRVVATEAPAAATGAPVEDVVAALERAARPIVLAGPGVVRDGAVDGLRALAAAGSLGVLNTWGAKGVFDWTSPHHLATAGLQARDFELGGLAGADLVVAAGVDEAEALGGWRLAPVIEVAPGDLRAVAARWGRPPQDIPVPVLRSELARVTQEGWQAVTAPLPPTRVTLAYREALGPGGLVVADPGVAGFWVARTLPTSGLGGAIVPAEADRPGFAAACAVVARRLDPGRLVLAAVDAVQPIGAKDLEAARRLGVAVDATTAQVLEAARRLGVAVAVEVWSPGGEALDAGAHEARLARLLREGGIVTLQTDGVQLRQVVDVAGPIVAWGGLPQPDVPASRVVGEGG